MNSTIIADVYFFLCMRAEEKARFRLIRGGGGRLRVSEDFFFFVADADFNWEGSDRDLRG